MNPEHEILSLHVDDVVLEGELTTPEGSHALVIFSHGSGSSRFSPRNNYVAGCLQRQGIATFLFDLLTEAEDLHYTNRFNIPLLGERLVNVTRQLLKLPSLNGYAFGFFGASTGAASALIAASVLKEKISAVVSRGGRPDLAEAYLPKIQAPSLFIVGERDEEVMELNRYACSKLTCPHQLVSIPDATHLFEEPGTLQQVADVATAWFLRYLLRSERLVML
ncbi:MAG: dienelactone hydrolase family protein [Cyclobacteriaceae bacterium]|jgi:predicted alpha/beta-hydrolase family hydrolase|nr:dienelactone hydrolase family protein [Cyclobacteriaceae bacterium]